MRNLMKDRYEKVEMAANLLLDNSFQKIPTPTSPRPFTTKCRAAGSRSSSAPLEDALSRYCDNVIARLRTSVPSLSPQEMTPRALYCAAGLSARVISMLTDRSAASLYTARHRLRKKYRNLAFPRKQSTNFSH